MIRFRTLGESTIDIDSARIGPEAVVLFGFILYLAMQDGRPVPRTRLREIFWPNTPEKKAWHALRQVLYRLRRLNVALEVTPSQIRLDRREISLDLDMALSAASSTGNGANGSLAPDSMMFLQGYAPQFSVPFSEWLEEQREIVQARLRGSLLTAISSARSRGDWAALERTARMCLAIDPLNEQATLAMAEARAMSGSETEALAILDRYTSEITTVGPPRPDLPSTVLRRRIADRLVGAPTSTPQHRTFVGRADAMAMLGGILHRARCGIGETIFIVGEAGIGKTRLLEEIARVSALEGVRSLRVACRPDDRDRPLGLFVELVPRLMKLRGAAGCSPESLELLARFSDCHASPSAPSEAAAEAEVLATRIRRAIDDLVAAVASERPVLVVVDDVQWIDRASWELLMGVAHRSAERAMALVCASRQPPAETSVSLRLNRLPPLDDAAASELLVDLLTASGTSYEPPTIAECLRFARGNPFWLRELAAHWRTPRAGGAFPPSLGDLIAHRLDGLGVDALSALQAAGMLGRHATLGRIQAVLELGSRAFVRVMEELGSSTLAVMDGDRVAVHDLVIERASARLSEAGRRAMHMVIASRFERELRDAESISLVWECARHLEAAGARHRAIPVVQACAAHLVELGLPRDAAVMLDGLLDRCRTNEEMVSVLDSRISALHIATDWAGLVDAIPHRDRLRDQGGMRADGHSDDEILLVEARWRTSERYEPILADALACVEDATASPRHRLAAATHALILNDTFCDRSVVDRVMTLVAPLFPLVARDDPRDALTLGMMYDTSHGDLATAFRDSHRLIELDRQAGNPGRLARTLRFAFNPAHMLGYWAEGEACLHEAMSISESYGLTSGLVTAMTSLANAAADREELGAARAWSERAIRTAGAGTGKPPLMLAITAARIELMEGRPHAARAAMAPFLDRMLADNRTRFRNCGLGLALRIERLSGAGADPTLVEHLYRGHLRARSWAHHDEETEALVCSLIDLDRSHEAQELLTAYVTRFRREQWPLPSTLREVCSELGVSLRVESCQASRGDAA